MAIDTAAKRASILGFGSGDMLPVPDGTIAVADRLTFLWLYGGITPAEVATAASIYRPQTATAPAAYRPGSVGGPLAYRPLGVPLPAVYRPENTGLPSG